MSFMFALTPPEGQRETESKQNLRRAGSFGRTDGHQLASLRDPRIDLLSLMLERPAGWLETVRLSDCQTV